MNFDEAIKAHSRWKMTLRTYISKPDKSLNPDVVSRDDQCPLGKWIHGEGGALQGMAEFATLRTEHARFHKAAAEVIRLADKGESVTEQVSLGGNSVFTKASNAVINAIMMMKSKTAKTG